MSVPGFAAEASLYVASSHYVLTGASAPDMLPCGSPNWVCCSPPGWVSNPNNIVSCDAGWGCDVASGGWCVQPCGDPGQPCCDGPDTLAPRWTVVNGKVYVYSPEGLGPDGLPLKEMCRSGVCDPSTHRCIACGTEVGKPCCPPDPNYGVARCRDLHLECQFDSGTVTSGTCASCGIRGSPPCDWGCDPGLGVRKALCDVCCGDQQPPCDTKGCSSCDDTGCCSGLKLAGGLCRQCGASGQIPCDGGCDPGLGVKNGICTPCGDSGQPPCENGCRPDLGIRGGVCAFCGHAGQDPCDNGCSPGLGIQGGRCSYCGGSGQLPCDSGCIPPYRLAGGRCQLCGAFTQPPCDVGGCDPGLVLENGQCVSPTPCANLGEACVPDTQTGTHCCQSSTNPVKCVLSRCQACVPHGQQCTAQNQRCCDPNDICKLDQATETFICDIAG